MTAPASKLLYLPFLLILLLALTLHITHILIPLRNRHLHHKSRLAHKKVPVYQHRWTVSIPSQTPSVKEEGIRYELGFRLKRDLEDGFECGRVEKRKGRVVRLLGSGHLVRDCGYRASFGGPLLREYYRRIGNERRGDLWEWEHVGRDLLMEVIVRKDWNHVGKVLKEIRKESEGLEKKNGLAFWGRLEMVARSVVALRSLGVCKENIEELGGVLETVGRHYWKPSRRSSKGKSGSKDVWEMETDTLTLATRAAVFGIVGNVGNGQDVRVHGQKMAKKFAEKIIRFQKSVGNGLYCGRSHSNEFQRIYQNGLTALYLGRLYSVSRTHSLHKLLAKSLKEALDVKRLRIRLRNLNVEEGKRRAIHMLYIETLMKNGEMLRNGRMMGLARELAEEHLNMTFTVRTGVEVFRSSPWRRCENRATDPFR